MTVVMMLLFRTLILMLLWRTRQDILQLRQHRGLGAIVVALRLRDPDGDTDPTPGLGDNILLGRQPATPTMLRIRTWEPGVMYPCHDILEIVGASTLGVGHGAEVDIQETPRGEVRFARAQDGLGQVGCKVRVDLGV